MTEMKQVQCQHEKQTSGVFTLSYFPKSAHTRFYKHTFQFAGSLAFLPAFCQISDLILKKSFWFYRYYIKAQVLTTILLSRMNTVLQVSARHNPQTDNTSLDNFSFGSFLSQCLNPLNIYYINVQFCVKEEGEDLVFYIEEIVKKAVLEMLISFFWRHKCPYTLVSSWVVFLFVQFLRWLVSHIPFSCASCKIKASQKLAPAGDIRTTT